MWYHIPGVSSIWSMYAAGTVGSGWLSTLRSMGMCAPCCTVSGTLTPRPFSWRGWRTRPWIARLSGTMLSRSEAQRCLSTWADSTLCGPSCARGTRASHSVAPESALVRTIRDIYGRGSLDSLKSFARESCSLKMYLDTCEMGSREFTGTFVEWVTGLRRDYLVRRRSAQVIDESDCLFSGAWRTPDADVRSGLPLRTHARSRVRLKYQVDSWPTPLVHDVTQRGSGQQPSSKAGNACLSRSATSWMTPRAADAHGADYQYDQADRTKPRLALPGQAKVWSTPGADSFSSRGGERKGEEGLTHQAVNWPTPAARDYRSVNLGTHHQDQLPNFVEHIFLRQDQDCPPRGKKLSKRSLSTRLRLNPLFTEWLMGLCLGWTQSVCGVSGMEWCRWRRLMRSSLWRLVSDEQS